MKKGQESGEMVPWAGLETVILVIENVEFKLSLLTLVPAIVPTKKFPSLLVKTCE